MRRPNPDRIRELRGDESQEQLAVRAGITRNTVRLLESGQSKRPMPLTLKALADAFGTTVDDITREEVPA